MTDPLAPVRLEGAPPFARLLSAVLPRRRWLIPLVAVSLAALTSSPTPLLILAALVIVPLDTVGLSMLPTLSPRTAGVAVTAPIRRGDVVLVVVEGWRPVVKRVVAVAGDQVMLHEGRVTVNGELTSSPLPLDLSDSQTDVARAVAVPDGHVFLMGDHVCSIDSRHFGCVPRATVMGRYLPLLSWGATPRSVLAPEDAAAVDRVLQSAVPAAAGLRRMLDVGGHSAGYLTLAVRLGLLQLGDRPAVEALLERALARDPDPGERALWTVLLARMQLADQRNAEALATLERRLRLGVASAHDPALFALHATALSRVGRYAEALERAEEVERRWPELGFQGSRIAALVGLGRLTEAQARIDELTASGGWGLPVWEPWYRSYLAAARDDTARAAELVAEALRRGLPAALVRQSRLLQPLRDSPDWERVRSEVEDP